MKEEIDEFALNQCAWTFLAWIRENGINMDNVKPALREVFNDYQKALRQKDENPLKVYLVKREDLIDTIKMLVGRDGIGMGMRFSERLANANEILDQIDAEEANK